MPPACLPSWSPRLACLLVALLLLAAVPPAVRAEFTATVPVADSSAAARTAAFGAALGEVLGARGMPAGELPADAEAYVSSYRYRQEGPDLQLVVSFDEAGVGELLGQAGLSADPAAGPQVLLFVLQDEPGGPRVARSDVQDELAESLTRLARSRGLRPRLPDGFDVVQADVDGLAYGRTGDLARLAADLGVQASLVARLSGEGDGGLTGDWELLGATRWQTGPGSLAANLEAGLDRTRSLLRQQAAAAAPAPHGASRHAVVVEGVQDVATYARVLRDLSRPSAVQSVEVRGLAGDQLALTLRTRAIAGEALTEELLRGEALQTNPFPPSAAGAGAADQAGPADPFAAPDALWLRARRDW